MRRREISSSFWKDERVWGISDAARLAFIGLWQLADREGRLVDTPFSIGVEIRPWDPRSVAGLIDELVTAGLVIRYQVDGQRVLSMRPDAWRRHQRPHPKEQESKLPPPPSAPQHAETTQGAPLPAPRCSPESTKVLPSRAGSSEPSGPSGPSEPSGPSAGLTLLRRETPSPLPPTPSIERQAPASVAVVAHAVEPPKPKPVATAPPQPALTRPPRRLDPTDFADGLWVRLQKLREERLGLLREEPPHRHDLGDWVREAMLETQGDDERILAGFSEWLDDDWVRRRKATWDLWRSPKQWRRAMPAKTVRIEAPSCARCGEASIGQAWGTDVCAGCNAEWSASDGEGEAGFRAWLGRRPALRAVGGGL